MVVECGGEVLFGAGSVGEDSERGVEGSVGYVVAFGPVLPRGEGLEADPLFADGRQHGVEPVDGVAGPEVLVCVALVGDRLGVAFDGGAGSLAGAFEVVLGAVELMLGDVEFVAERAVVPAGGGVEPMHSCAVASTGVDGAGLRVVERASIGGGGGRYLGENDVGEICGGGCVGSSGGTLRLSGLGVDKGVVGVGEDGREPVRDLAAWRRGRCRSRGLSWAGLGEGAALRGGGNVGPVGGDDRFEDVAGLGDVVTGGDDAQDVVVVAAGGGDVQAAPGGGR
jgi:hypothetical protein